MKAHVLLSVRLNKLEDKAAFEAAFAEVSRTIVDSIPGIIRDELIRDVNDPNLYILLSEWESKQAWFEWENSSVHTLQINPLRQYWTPQGVRICEIAFCLDRVSNVS